MKISEFISMLEEIKNKEGDLAVCISEGHEYWGSVQRLFTQDDLSVIEYAKPKGPKSGEFEKALVIIV